MVRAAWLLVPVRGRGRVDGEHGPGDGALELGQGLVGRPGQHPGLHHRGRMMVELADGGDQVRGLQVGDLAGLQGGQGGGQPAAQRVATQVRSPAVGGREPQRGADLVAGFLLGQPAALGGVGDRAQGPLLRAVQHRPAPLPARIRSTRSASSSTCGSMSASSVTTVRSVPVAPSATEATNCGQNRQGAHHRAASGPPSPWSCQQPNQHPGHNPRTEPGPETLHPQGFGPRR